MSLWLTRDLALEDQEPNYCLWSRKPKQLEAGFVSKPGRGDLHQVFCKREREKHTSVKLEPGDIHRVESIVVKLR